MHRDLKPEDILYRNGAPIPGKMDGRFAPANPRRSGLYVRPVMEGRRSTDRPRHPSSPQRLLTPFDAIILAVAVGVSVALVVGAGLLGAWSSSP